VLRSKRAASAGPGSAVERAGRSAQRSSTAELAEIYRQHADYVWRIARHLGVAEAELADVVHDVFLVVLRRLREYDGRASMRTWLYHQTRGIVSNRRRGQRRATRRLQLLERSAEVQLLARATEVHGESPETHMERVQAAEFVRAFLATLEPPRRSIFELVELDGLRVSEAADCLNVNINTAHARLRAARAAFRAAVARRLTDHSSPTEVPCPRPIRIVGTPTR